MGFWANFADASNIFDGFEATTSFDPFEIDQTDTDRSGLSNDIDDLDENSPFELDDDAEELGEDLDTSDVEPGEAVDEDSINKVDLDFDVEDGADVEPDWNPMDHVDDDYDATDISDESDSDTRDTEIKDEPYDEWSEVSPNEEIDQWDDIIQDDEISQLEETGFDEPLYYDEEEDMLDDPTNEASEDIEYVDHRDDLTDNITDEIEDPGRDMLESSGWVDNLEDFLDFTEQDVSSFHEVSTGFEMDDGYDPPYFPDEAVDMLELGNIVDDVFADAFPDPVNDPFWWFDSFE